MEGHLRAGAVRELLHGGFGEGGGYQETEWQVACSASYFSTVARGSGSCPAD